ncbi:hypothetical protein FOZ62_009774, partial [Perkinsus olseni]
MPPPRNPTGSAHPTAGAGAGGSLSAVSQSSDDDVDELVDTLNSSLDVIKDALRQPATPDSADFINNLMLEIQQNRDKLQARAEELVESGQFGSTDRIFEALEQVSQVEPRFDTWTRNITQQQQQQQQGGNRPALGRVNRLFSRQGSSSTDRNDPLATIPSFGFGEETERLNASPPPDDDDEDYDDDEEYDEAKVQASNTRKALEPVPTLSLPGVAGRSRQQSGKVSSSRGKSSSRRRSHSARGGSRKSRSSAKTRRTRRPTEDPSSSNVNPTAAADTANTLPQPPSDEDLAWDALPVQGASSAADAVAAWDDAFANANDNAFQTIPD